MVGAYHFNLCAPILWHPSNSTHGAHGRVCADCYLIFHHRFLVVDLVRCAVEYKTPSWLQNVSDAHQDKMGAQRAVFTSATGGQEPAAKPSPG